jgi:hypothetical protein
MMITTITIVIEHEYKMGAVGTNQWEEGSR